MSGQITGAGALTKAGTERWLLTNSTNNYGNGTIVNAGTLASAPAAACCRRERCHREQRGNVKLWEWRLVQQQTHHPSAR